MITGMGNGTGSASGAAGALPPGLTGPVDVALSRPVAGIPTPASIPGGCAYEPKWDGFRMVAAVTGTTGAPVAHLWSRQRNSLNASFPDLLEACARLLPPGTVVDGEAVVWHHNRLDFDELLRRSRTRPGLGPSARAGTPALPATLMLFDVLAVAGRDVRRLRYTERRLLLDELGASLTPPLQVTPSTTDPAQAATWFETWAVAGVEGLVVKPLTSRYDTGRRTWLKVKHRETTEVVLGAVTGDPCCPDTVIAGRLNADGKLRIVGRSVPLPPATARELGAQLAAAHATDTHQHPWPTEIFSGVWGLRSPVAVTRLDPVLVAEVSADGAMAGGRFRHAFQYLRLRTDLSVADVPALPT